MELDRQPPDGPDAPDDKVESTDSRLDPVYARVDDPWAKSDEERDRDFAEARQQDLEYVAANSRTLLGRHSEAAGTRDGESAELDHGDKIIGPQGAIDQSEQQSDRMEASPDKINDARSEPDRWSDPDAGQAWVAEWTSEPEHIKLVTSAEPWAKYQREHAGDHEVKLTTDNPRDKIWADGLAVDSDRVVAVEAKYVTNPDRSLYEGRAPSFMVDSLMKGFDDEMRRYGEIIRHGENPVARLRIVTNTEAAAAFLGERASRVIGEDVDLVVEVRKEEGES